MANSIVKVSVIIPVYNTEKYIGRCLDSCLLQTLKDIEIVVINDGSTDRSLDVMRRYAEKDSRIRIKSIPNSGLSIARNAGMGMARGAFIYFLDSDDWIDESCLEICYKTASNNRLDMVMFDARTYTDNQVFKRYQGNYNRKGMVDSKRIFSGREFIEKYINSVILVQAWIVFVRKDFLNQHEILFLENAYYEDVKFHFDCMIHAKRIMYIDKCFYNRFYRNDSIVVSGINLRKALSIYEIICGIIDSLEENTDLFWLKYVALRSSEGVDFVYGKMTGKEMQELLAFYTAIEEMQYQCIIKFWNKLISIQEHLDNIHNICVFIEEITKAFKIVPQKIQHFIGETVREYRNYVIKSKLDELPFSEGNKRIGIYGSGSHSDYVLEKYEELFGSINCDYIYIDSEKPSYKFSHRGKDIVNVADLEFEMLDGIVILSYLHETEMLERLQDEDLYSVPVYTLYHGDCFPMDREIQTEIDSSCRLSQYMKNEVKNRIILVNIPEHSNIGDYIITLSEEKFLKEHFSDYEVVEISGKKYREHRESILPTVLKTDVIMVTGGGFWGSLWSSGINLKMILEDLRFNKTIIMPQSVYYSEDECAQKMKTKMCRIVEEHRDLMIFYRERFSYEWGSRTLGGEISQYLCPDMALFLDGYRSESARKGILLVLRKDLESCLSMEDRSCVKKYFQELGEKVDESSMHHEFVIENELKHDVIVEKAEELSSYNLVVTDTLHCMILCALTGTPCIACNNLTKKLEGVYEWLRDLRYIEFVKDVRQIPTIYKKLRGAVDNEQYYSQNFQKYESMMADLIRNRLQGI